MKAKILFLLACLVCAGAYAQESAGAGRAHTLYIVRHAEKNPGKDSTLTPAGEERATQLAKLLRKKKIGKIYVTPYKRSFATARPLYEKSHIDTVHYRPDTTGVSLLQTIRAHGDGNTHLLIVGHSNTVIPLVKALGGSTTMTEIPENEFDHLFILKVSADGTVSTTQKKYGNKQKRKQVAKMTL
jgi:phosphohistidine phosphatase SixA